LKIPIIKTSRLVLRPFTDKDVEPLFRILQEHDILRYFPNPNPPSREQVEKLVSGQLRHWEEHKLGWWALDFENQMIGWCGLQFLPETREIEVGFLISKVFWGQGLATEAARSSLLFGFQDLDLECIVGIVHHENVASQRVVQKLGMSFTVRTSYFGMDCYRYSIDKYGFNRGMGSWIP
jgi:RimJ/RimL family protein N-acetyltransferase